MGMIQSSCPLNTIVGARVGRFFDAGDWEGLRNYLTRLSHKDFQSAGQYIGCVLMPSVDENTFWTAFYCLVDYHSKAFLMTLLKSVPQRMAEGTFNLQHNGFIVLSNYLNTKHADIDKGKIIRFLLTVIQSVEDIEYLLIRLKVDSLKDRLDYLLRGSTLASYYMLFKTLRELEHDRNILMRSAAFLMKKEDSLAFNFVSLMKVYFDLPEIKGTFSLRINPYEIGRAEASFDSFVKILDKFKS